MEAALHLLQDWGMVVAQDYAFSFPPRRSVEGRKVRRSGSSARPE